MFLARKVKSENEEKIADEILKQYDIEDVVNYNSAKYVLVVDDSLVGVSKVDFHENIGVLKYLAIDKSAIGNGLGDALIRAILNYCIMNGIDKVYYPMVDSYLTKLGFVEKKNCLKIDGERREFALEIELEPFFAARCKGSTWI